MTLWVILTLIIAIVTAALTIPLARRYDIWRTRGDALAVLRDQLRDLDSLPDAEAAPLRIEIQRRILAEGASEDVAPRPFAPGMRTWLAVATAAILAGLSTGLYISLGRPELAATPPSVESSGPANAETPGDVAGMIADLESKMATNAKDPEGWRMLGWSYFQTRRFADAAEAYRKAAELVPTDATYVSAMGEALVQSAAGTVTPAAQAAFETARRLDAGDARSRYYLALLKEQRGNPKAAIADWVQLLREAPADAPWAGELRRIIAESGKAAGIDVSADLPPSTAPAPAGALPGPTPEDVAAAQKMRPSDQQAMIRGMVDGLAAKLVANPKDAQGWMRLMRARMVLGETGAASNAYRTGRAAFAGDAATQGQLDAAAKELGIAS